MTKSRILSVSQIFIVIFCIVLLLISTAEAARKKKQVSYYDILEVKQNASPRDIRRSYRQLAVQYHPDKSIESKEDAEEKFLAISHAYQILSDDTKRVRYDQLLSYGQYEYHADDYKEDLPEKKDFEKPVDFEFKDAEQVFQEVVNSEEENKSNLVPIIAIVVSLAAGGYYIISRPKPVPKKSREEQVKELKKKSEEEAALKVKAHYRYPQQVSKVNSLKMIEQCKSGKSAN
eukprot:TRINITY_DN8449_c0_g1_i1.p1 TRINITY_DN8449_c0_g1~~TRINITY_DN8449_c0_g1_i1.p1  ORF type:complete len:232 (+),score=44.73 TRINITY_DN8449_c0_g1_i1:48-743(+)